MSDTPPESRAKRRGLETPPRPSPSRQSRKIWCLPERDRRCSKRAARPRALCGKNLSRTATSAPASHAKRASRARDCPERARRTSQAMFRRRGRRTERTESPRAYPARLARSSWGCIYSIRREWLSHARTLDRGSRFGSEASALGRASACKSQSGRARARELESASGLGRMSA